ncbi:ABC transporter ATP-binding protein [Spirochaeta isovalerica]|uniref:ABC-2 type transport system ATP-binding protein n=1 Tax=Spirochaeta isovalerica TaxID=150 RepID=A0A841R9J3_9SPIO|nr:ABC transporter ATP-binding protein [Spirochaeta isovalerica]MBB6479378.1 ABC-2 type transport system ATP-binding protein [Spirochaeta isovalerica]
MSHSDGMTVLEARDFVKNYGAVKAVRGVSFSVKKGEIFGLIGPDGGGKTSLMRSFVSLLKIDGGELYFKGRSVRENPDFVRQNIGYMPQRFSLYQDMSVAENLRFFADLFNVDRVVAENRIEELYGFSGLKPFSKRKAGALSGGMKQKLALSCMLVHSPDVVILDEPTFGVDPVSRSEFWQILSKLKEEGTSILVSTAYMDEADLCDRVGLMFNGRILVHDRPSALPGRYPGKLYSLCTDDPHLVHDALEESGLCGECNLFGEGVHLTLSEGVVESQIRELLELKSLGFESFGAIDCGIEDLFLLLMKGDGDER